MKILLNNHSTKLSLALLCPLFWYISKIYFYFWISWYR